MMATTVRRKRLLSRLLVPCIFSVVSLFIIGATAVGLGQYEMVLLKRLAGIEQELTALARMKANISLIDSKLTRVLYHKDRDGMQIVLEEADKIQYLVGDYRKLIKARNDFVDISNLGKHESGFDQIMSLSIRVVRYAQSDNMERAERIYEKEYTPAFSLSEGLFEKALFEKPEQRDMLMDEILFLKQNSMYMMLGAFLFAVLLMSVWLRKAYKDLVIPVDDMSETLKKAGSGESSSVEIDDALTKVSSDFKVEEFHNFAQSLLDMRHAVSRSERDLIQRTHEAEQANLSKSQFLAAMSHEIRTPMNGVLGMAQLLLQTELDEDQIKKVKALLRSGDSLLVILNEILDYSKIEANKLELETINVDLKEIGEDVGSYFGTLAREKGIELNLEMGDTAPELLIGDPTRIRQVLNNLASNAIKFTSEGTVTILISSHVVGDSARVHMEVRDSGIGINEEALKTIFDPFSQAESSTTRKFGGTGLGLAITHDLVEMMNGTINVKSQIDMGTMFIIDLELPVSEDQRVEADSELEQIELSTMKLLVVDDTPINVMILKMMLEKLGHQVDSAEDGEQAVEMIKADRYDVVFMDYHMPNMDGKEATIAVREMDHPNSDTVIVGCTADAFKDVITSLKGIGQNEVITKPVDQGDVMNILVKYHRG